MTSKVAERDRAENHALVCVAGVYCVNRTQDAYSGYEIEVFKRIQNYLGWESAKLEWLCLDQTVDVTQRLQNGTCDVAVGMQGEPELVKQGIDFSWPTSKYNLNIVILADEVEAGYFSFMSPFAWNVWVLLLITVVFAGFMVWFLEWVMIKKLRYTDEWKEDVYDSRREVYAWKVIAHPFVGGGDDITVTFPSYIVIIAFGFLILIMTSLFTANLAADLTTSRLRHTINSVLDLPGVSVATFPDYIDILATHGVAAAQLPWRDGGDEDAALNLLRSGSIAALVLPSDLAQYKTGPDCRLFVVPAAFEQFDVAVAFRPGLTRLVQEFDEAILGLLRSGDLENLRERHVNPPRAECSFQYEEGDKVTLNLVAGLWIIFAAAVGISLLCVLGFYVYHEYAKAKVLKHI